MKNKLKTLLKDGQRVIGPFFTVNAPDFIEIAALCGFDFGVMDMEHGAFAPENVVGALRAADCRGLTPLVRVPNAEDATILKALDTGAHGIIVPQVSSGEMAESIVRAAHYHPVGRRGLGLGRAADYEYMPVDNYFSMLRKELMIIAQCETQEGLDNIDKIAATPYIDVVFLGPFDLSQSLGIPGHADHPEIQKAAARTVEVCAAAGKTAGIFARTGEQARQRAEEGFNFIALGTDIGLFAASGKREIAAFKPDGRRPPCDAAQGRPFDAAQGRQTRRPATLRRGSGQALRRSSGQATAEAAGRRRKSQIQRRR